MYELYGFIFTSIIFECGGGILYGIAVGFDPLLTLASTLAIDFIMIFLAVLLVEKFLEWKKGWRDRLQGRIAKGKRLIDKYAWLGIIIGIFVLSPVQIAIIGRLLGVKPGTLYPSLIGGTVLVALVFLGISLGVFQLIAMLFAL